MAQNKRVVLGFIIASALFVIVILFVIFNVKLFVAGPQIEILEPANMSAFEKPLIEIKGQTTNVAFISMNDHPIFVDEQGYFNEKLLLSPGLSIIELYAHDKFNRETSLLLHYVYNGTSSVPIIDTEELEMEIEQATSTEETSEINR